MKVRTCFVSNSSSSSFICDVCGREAGGMDVCLDDVDMCICENDHILCNYHIINANVPFDALNYEGSMTHYNNLQEYKDDDAEDIPACCCPICSEMSVISDRDRNKYLLKISGKTRQEIDEDIKSFENYAKFKEFLEKE